jgi:autotransporter-associated beta strand protein
VNGDFNSSSNWKNTSGGPVTGDLTGNSLWFNNTTTAMSASLSADASVLNIWAAPSSAGGQAVTIGGDHVFTITQPSGARAFLIGGYQNHDMTFNVTTINVGSSDRLFSNSGYGDATMIFNNKFIGSGRILVGNGSAGGVLQNGNFTIAGDNRGHSGGFTLGTSNLNQNVKLNINNTNALGTGVFVVGGTAAASGRTYTIDNTSGSDIVVNGMPSVNVNNNFTFAGTNALSFGAAAVNLGSATRTITLKNNTLAMGGVVSGTGGLTVYGPGTSQTYAPTLELTNAANTYSGITTVSNGATLRVSAAGSLPGYNTVGNVVVTGSGSTLALRAAGAGSWNETNINDLVTANAANFGAGTYLGIEVGAANRMTYSNVISGNEGFVKTGDGTLTLTGVNTYTGTTFINGGTLVAGDGTSDHLGSIINASSTASIVNNGTFVYNPGGNGTTKLGTTFAGVISGTGEFIKAGDFRLTLTNHNTFKGATTISGGTLMLGNTSAVGALDSQSIANEGSLVYCVAGSISASETYNGTISGAGSLTKRYNGGLTLGGNNTYTGDTSVEGALVVAQGGAMLFDINNMGTDYTQLLQYGGNTATVAGSITFNGAMKLDLSGVTGTSGSWNVVDPLLAANYNDSTFRVYTANGDTFQELSANVWTYANMDQKWTFTQATGTLAVSAVPEPSTIAMVVTGLLGLVAYAWRRKR